MATDLERLIVSLEARTTAFEKAMNRANGVAQRRGKQIESTFTKLNRNATAQFTALGRTVAGAFAVAGGARGAQNLIDSATRIENALKVAGLSGDELTRVYDRLFASAQRNAAPLESLVTLYGRAAIVQNELGVSTEELLGFTDNVALALRVAGTDAASASGALLQLSQALGSGTVRAEEFNSILEGALPIAQAAAAGLTEAGGSVAKLRALVVDGKVSSEAFFRAFEAGSVILQQKVAGAEATLSQRFVRLQNVLIDAAKEFDSAAGASESLGGALDDLADFISDVDFGNLFTQIDQYINQVGGAIKVTQDWARSIGQMLGLDVVGEALVNNPIGSALGLKSGRAMDRRMGGDMPGAPGAALKDFIRRNYGPTLPAVTTTTDKTSRIQPAVKPVSLNDYPVGGASGGGGGGRRGGGSGGRGDDFEREVEQIKKRTAAIQAETAAMAGLNPLLNDYGYALEKARMTQELLTAAQEAGKLITPELKSQIDALAEGYATASVEAEKLAERQDMIRDAADEIASLGEDVLGGFIDDLRSGVSMADALSNALNRVLDKLIDIGVQSIIGGIGGGGGIGGLLGGIFRANGGPVRKGQPYVVGERRAELFVPNQNGTILPSVPKVNAGTLSAGAGGRERIDIHLTDDSGRMSAIADQRIETKSGTIINVAVQRGQQVTQKNMPGYISGALERNG